MRLGTLMTDLGPIPPTPEPDDLPDSSRVGPDGATGPGEDVPDPTAPEEPVRGPDPANTRAGYGNPPRVPLPGPRSAVDDGTLPRLDGGGPPPPGGPGPLMPDPSEPGDLSWAEHDWEDALLRARRAGRAYVYLNLVEQRLRAVVRQVLQPVYGTADPHSVHLGHDDGAWVVAAAGPTQSEWVERAEAVREMSRRRGYIVDPADDDLVAFLTLPQLRELVVRNWWCFAPYLTDRRALERALEEVEIGRHIVARNRVLSPDVLRQVERACTRVLAELDGRLGRHAGERLALDAVEELFAGRYADLVAVFPDRSALQRKLPVADLVGEAHTIDAMGVSLNLLCQNYSGRELHRLTAAGCRVRMLFLNPAGDAMRTREKEEGVKRGILSRLTTLNILHARKIRAKLAEPNRIEIRVYEETPRFNAYLVDGDVAVVQPYLRRSRGVESPSFVLRAEADPAAPQRGLFALFQEEFDQLWAAGKRTA
ncbi:SAV2148 family HEPN domain-containing protein [Yinghuangia seranimata]|uniref:SAV2148 family HEPN domain-containing protein n=1 Tax=Yinghuangia seranimata TaxID=408067 RepID=UPI00248C3910|nr:SAV2148 family HEPN domain-containing protein [Yinghuangia seranimata]MDI2125138.1 SAV2148 family HEPN domain-containing protein [Yinghuangia seranimata]